MKKKRTKNSIDIMLECSSKFGDISDSIQFRGATTQSDIESEIKDLYKFYKEKSNFEDFFNGLKETVYGMNSIYHNDQVNLANYMLDAVKSLYTSDGINTFSDEIELLRLTIHTTTESGYVANKHYNSDEAAIRLTENGNRSVRIAKK